MFGIFEKNIPSVYYLPSP